MRFLLKIRHVVTAPFGLDNKGPEATQKMGLFPVISKDDHEMLLGFDDKHLDFRISVLKQEDQFYVGTWVHTHHWGGKLYLLLVMPFHKLAVSDAVRRVVLNSKQA